MTRPLRHFASAKFLRFLFAGGVAALANILSRVALSGWIAYVPSIIVAYLIGMVTAYLLNRIMVFGAGDRGVSGEVVWFVIVNALAVLQTLIVSVGLAWYVLPAIGVTSHDEMIAHVVGVIVPVFTSYLGHKHWTFRNHVKA